MTQEDKELLLKDICARLPYNAKVEITFASTGIKIKKLDAIALGVVKGIANGYITDTIIKPYLFPLSSMTEEQKKYIADRWGINENFDFEIDPNWGKYFVELGDTIDFINWLNENHFDYRCLIPKGLAIDATGINNN